MDTLPSLQDLSARVEQALAEVQPSLGLHGGSIELVKIDETRVAHLRFLGACIGCAAATYTLEYGVKEFLLMRLEDLEDVVAVNEEPVTHAAPTLSHAAS